MKLTTKNFGDIDIDENKIISFADGIPGFPDDDKYVLLNDDLDENGEESPFLWMQSVKDGDICFILIDALTIFSDYDPQVDKDDLLDLGDYEKDGYNIYNIAKFPSETKDATVNLKAPIVVNYSAKLGKQVVCMNEEYTVRHKIFGSTSVLKSEGGEA